jgi:nucleotide-binding universal stress UspA family protein
MARVLIPTNGSPAAQLAVEKGLELAVADGADVVFLLAVPWSDPRVPSLDAPALVRPLELEVSSRDVALHEAAEAAQRSGVRYDLLVLAGDPLRVILDAADRLRPDFLVIGSESHPGALEHLRSSLAEKVSRRARCDVVVVTRHP